MSFMSGDRSVAARKAAAQQLSSLRAAGVSRVASRARKKADGSAGNPEPVAEAAPAPAVASPARPASLFESARSTMPRAQREEKLQILSARVAQCTRCAELSQTRTKTVFGVGNPEARIMFLGEAPGADEDRQGEPFVGAAGQLLNRILEACKLQRTEVYICNILRCRPPGNRTPAPDEAANCREYLEGQIEIVDPDYIVCLGSVAAKNLLASMESIGKLRGRFFNYGRAKVVCTYHPAYLLRNPAAKKDVWGDMKFLMHDMGVEL
jgi:uracil-DNA glycosylase